MALTVNTNMQALRIQENLTSASARMGKAMERMASGYKINSSKDDAAGLAVSTTLQNTISSSKIASDNVGIGEDLLSTAEGTLDVISQNLSRIRDLTEQASNGSYSQTDRQAIAAEVEARLSQIDTLAKNSSFNGIKLLDGTATVTLQVGTGGATGDRLQLSSSIFTAVDISSLTTKLSASISATTFDATNVSGAFTAIDAVISGVIDRVTKIGAGKNQLEAVADGLTVQQNNLTSALSTIRDADVAEESASFVQSQILQQASASLLIQANSAPQIALSLIKG